MTSSAQPIQVHKTRAKHGYEWTYGDLHFYNISIAYETSDAFFQYYVPDSYSGCYCTIPAAPLPPTFDTDFLTALNPEDAKIYGGDAYRLIQYLDEAMMGTPGEESATSDFVVALLRALDFAPKGAMIRTGIDFPFRVDGEKRYAKADVCIVEGTDPLLIVQQDKSHVYPLGGDADARLIAAAIAAYDKDALYRAEYNLKGRSPLPVIIDAHYVIGIVMSGSWPTFFKICSVYLCGSVLSNTDPAIRTPPQRTTVCAYRPTVPRPQQRLKEGMKPLDNRKLLVTDLLRLKQLMLWTSGKPFIPPAQTGTGIQSQDGSS